MSRIHVWLLSIIFIFFSHPQLLCTVQRKQLRNRRSVALKGASPSSADWRHRIFSLDRRISEHILTCREPLEDICSGHGRIHGHSHHRESGQALGRIQRFRIVQHSHPDLSLIRALLRVYTVRDHRRISMVPPPRRRTRTVSCIANSMNRRITRSWTFSSQG